jgi:DNA-binding transcriptional regulator YhcF (GntR family)
MSPAPLPPPYRQIADSLRARIEDGRLRAGDPVPSTRALARRWKVALATAAHALNALRAEGWVRTVPRVGAVVAGREKRRGARGPAELSQASIVAAAISLADSEGLGAMSFRGVAARLDAPVTSLYRHVDGKEALLRAMTDAVLGESSLPPTPPAGWRPQLEAAARAHWATLRRHPWLARAISITRPRPLENAVAHANWVLRALDGHGLDAAARMDLHIVLHAFIQGMAVNLETEAEAVSETGLSDAEWMDGELASFSALAATGRYPAFARVLDELDSSYEPAADRLFELGLSTMLDGFATRFAPRRLK